MKRIYLDYAASTPVDRRVERAMQPYFGKVFANPHSLHQFGQEASRGVFDSHRKIAQSIGADYKEIIFTGSATEANNLAIRGTVKASDTKKPRIVTTTIEHESVLETCRDLEKDGVEVVYVPVSREGLVDFKKLKAALNDRTVLVSVMHANNETGTIQPISEIAKIIEDFRKDKKYPLLHTDAVQSFQYLDCNVDHLGVDLLTMSAHKIYGPKGIGALYVRDKKLLAPIITGSGQEFGLRSGTDNVPYLVGFAKAAEIADQMRESEAERVEKLRDYFWSKLKKTLPNIQVNGSMKRRLPNNLNIYFPGYKNQDLLIKFDIAGVAVSPGAACSTRVSKVSFVLESMGFTERRAGGSLRFSLGRQTTKQDIDHSVKVIARSLKQI